MPPADDDTAAAPSGVVKPSGAAYARAIRANLWVAVPLLLISLVRIGLTPWLLPVFVVALAAVFGGIVLYFRNTRVEFGGGRYRATDLIGRSREFGAGEVARVVTVASLVSGSRAPTAPQLLLLRDDGSPLLRLRGQTWEVARFTELAADLIAHGVARDDIPDPITTAQLRERYPRVVGWWEAHPIAFGLVLGLALVALALGITVAVYFSS